MVRVLKRKSIKSKLSAIALSSFILPVLLFSFIIVTLPVIFLATQQEQDIRQNAATLTTHSLTINTEDVSYQVATEEVITSNNITIISLTSILVVIMICTVIVVFYRKRLSY